MGPEPTQQTQAAPVEIMDVCGLVLIQMAEQAILGWVVPSEGFGEVNWVAMIKKPKEEGTFAIPLCGWLKMDR